MANYNFIEKWLNSENTAADEKGILEKLYEKIKNIIPPTDQNAFLQDIQWIGKRCISSKEVINLLYAVLAPFELEKEKSILMSVYEELRKHNNINNKHNFPCVFEVVNAMALMTSKEKCLVALYDKIPRSYIQETGKNFVVNKIAESRQTHQFNLSNIGIPDENITRSTRVTLHFLTTNDGIYYTPTIMLNKKNFARAGLFLNNDNLDEPLISYSGIPLQPSEISNLNYDGQDIVLRVDDFNTTSYAPKKNQNQPFIQGVKNTLVSLHETMSEPDKKIKIANFNLQLLNSCMHTLYTLGCYPCLLNLDINLMEKYASQIINITEPWKTRRGVSFINSVGDLFFKPEVYDIMKQKKPTQKLAESLLYEYGTDLNIILSCIISRTPVLKENIKFSLEMFNNDLFVLALIEADKKCFKPGNFMKKIYNVFFDQDENKAFYFLKKLSNLKEGNLIFNNVISSISRRKIEKIILNNIEELITSRAVFSNKEEECFDEMQKFIFATKGRLSKPFWSKILDRFSEISKIDNVINHINKYYKSDFLNIIYGYLFNSSEEVKLKFINSNRHDKDFIDNFNPTFLDLQPDNFELIQKMRYLSSSKQKELVDVRGSGRRNSNFIDGSSWLGCVGMQRFKDCRAH